jgi:flagellin-like hook-associated protein FlgL
MKMIAKGAFALLIMASASSSFAQAEDPALRREIQRFYSEWDKAANAGNSQKMFSMVHPTFHSVMLNGQTMSYADIKRMHASTWSKPTMNCKTTLNHVNRQGNEVQAWITVVTHTKTGNGLMKKTIKLAQTLVRGNGGWQVSYMQELP